MALLDIIIPVFNSLKYTEACINSIYRNTDPKSFHLIVVDNASTDGTKSFLADLSNKVKNLDIISNFENKGWCQALNQAFRILSKDSQYVLWLNNDTLMEYDWLNKMLRHFKGGVGAVGPTSNYVAGRQCVIFNHGQDEEVAPYLIGFCLMLRREVISLVGDVDERFGIGGSEEFDYLFRMKKDLGLRCVIARDVYIHHFGSKTLWDWKEVGGTPEGYNKFHVWKDQVLREKWGDDFIDTMLGIKNTRDIVMGIIHPEEINWKFWISHNFIQRPPGTEVINILKPALVYDARNEIVENAKKLGFKKLLFWDADMIVHPDALFKLLSIEAPIKAGYFFSRHKPHFPCAMRKYNGKLASFYKPNSGIQEVDAVGSAFTLYDMKIFDEVPHPWFYPGEYGEDISLCLKARDKGYKIFVDTDLIIPHLSDKREIGPDDYLDKDKVCNEGAEEGLTII